jgi:transcriptional regulator with XRE-family HTH domain
MGGTSNSLFGYRVRAARRLRDLTQEALADQVGVSQAFISMIERGTITASGDLRHKLIETLNIPAAGGDK